jgi:hypothetical protein
LRPSRPAARTRRHANRRRVGRALEVKAPQQHGEPHDGLEERELVADALAAAAAEGQVLEVLGDLVGHGRVDREAAGGV